MTETEKTTKKEQLIRTLFEAGAHFGFSRRRRHPSVNPYLFGYKNNTAVIDLEYTTAMLDKACDFVRQLGQTRGVILLVGNKPEARVAIKKAALEIGMPFVAERWIGGTMTNFKQIRKRVERLLWIIEAELSGDLNKYTKKERLLFAKERKNLERYFSGITNMDKLPKAIFVIDPGAEAIAVAEARQLSVSVVAVANSDCDIRGLEYPIVANDTSKLTISLMTEKIIEAYKEGLKLALSVPEKVDSATGQTGAEKTETDKTIKATPKPVTEAELEAVA